MVELIGGSQQNELLLYCVSEVYVVSEKSPLLVDSLCIYIHRSDQSAAILHFVRSRRGF